MTRRSSTRPLPVCAAFSSSRSYRVGLTLVELLVAIAITLLIMSAVVTVFANVSGSVSRRRATIEMASQLRNVRETLARDLEGATCPAVPTQRPESNVGYLEIIEGPHNDHYPSPWIYDNDGNGVGDTIGGVNGIDLGLSTLPGSNLGADLTSNEEGRGLFVGANLQLPEEVKTDGRGLGDGDDILMLTVRNETEPFVGRIPSRTQLTGSDAVVSPGSASPAGPQIGFANWEVEETVSPLAEVAWFAVENRVDTERTFAFGEAGYRNIYRRVLLILPELDYRWNVRGVIAPPGTLWVLPEQRLAGGALQRSDVDVALAGLIAFQERFDVSARVEWDPLLPNGSADPGRWIIRANTLADLTRRENRYEHHGYAFEPPTLEAPVDNPLGTPGVRSTGLSDRYFPFAVSNAGDFYQPSTRVTLGFQADPFNGPPAVAADFQALTLSSNGISSVIAFDPGTTATANSLLSEQSRYAHRPFVQLLAGTDVPATARAILNEDGNVVQVTRGLAPLGGSRRGDDLMMTDALAFDLRVYDPGAPVYAYHPGGDLTESPDQLITPGDAGWSIAYELDVNNSNQVIGDAPTNANNPFRLQNQGAYVDPGYSRSFFNSSGVIPPGQRFVPRRLNVFTSFSGPDAIEPRFFTNGTIRTGRNNSFTRLYPTFDTWSSHYESDGVNQDQDDTLGLSLNDPGTNGIPAIDEGTNGLDNAATYLATDALGNVTVEVATRFGPDDLAERETPPPYDTALRGLQVTLRVYERDSRQIREMSVRESFVPE